MATVSVAPIEIRRERAGEANRIRALLVGSFPSAYESQIVDHLREDGDAVISLVAVEAGDVVGYVMLSRMSAPFAALGLGPLAVCPGRRELGVAGRLVRRAIAEARREGWLAIFVLGDPAYYARFGFSDELAAGFSSDYAAPYLMALALGEAGLPTTTGRIDYADAF